MLLLLQGVCDFPPSKPGSLDARSPSSYSTLALNRCVRLSTLKAWLSGRALSFQLLYSGS